MAQRGVNKVILVGNLGKDPEQKIFDNGGSLTNVVLATSESWKDKQTGEDREKTEWHNLVFRNKLGEIAANYLTKGSKIYVEGKLQTRKYQDQAGVEKYSTEINCNEMQMLDKKGDNPAPAAKPAAAPAAAQGASNDFIPL